MRGHPSQFMGAMEQKFEAQDSEAKVKTRTPSETEGMRHPREFQACLTELRCRAGGLSARPVRTLLKHHGFVPVQCGGAKGGFMKTILLIAAPITDFQIVELIGVVGLILLVGLVYNIQCHVSWLRENYWRVNRQKICEAFDRERALEKASKTGEWKRD
jgi:hypothetical protein